LDFRRAGLSPALSLLMSTFSLPISPPHPSQGGFTDELEPIATGHEDPLKSEGAASRNAPLPRASLRILSFGSRLEPRYIFAAGQLV
jgi:hypothetical protein